VLDYSFSRRVLRESVPQLLAGAVGMTLASVCMVAMPLLGSEFIKVLIQGDSFQSASKVRARGRAGPGGQAIETRARSTCRHSQVEWESGRGGRHRDVAAEL